MNRRLKKILLPLPFDIYNKHYQYTDEQKKMGIITKKLKHVKLRYLYNDISNDSKTNRQSYSFNYLSKKPVYYTNTYQSTYFDTRGKSMYNDYSKVKSRYETKKFGFEHLMKDVNGKINFLNRLFKLEEKKAINKINIGDKGQIINSNFLKDNSIPNQNISKKAYRTTMKELFSRIKNINDI